MWDELFWYSGWLHLKTLTLRSKRWFCNVRKTDNPSPRSQFRIFEADKSCPGDNSSYILQKNCFFDDLWLLGSHSVTFESHFHSTIYPGCIRTEYQTKLTNCIKTIYYLDLALSLDSNTKNLSKIAPVHRELYKKEWNLRFSARDSQFQKKMLLTVTSMRGKDMTVVMHLSNMLRSDPLELVRMSKKIFQCGWELALHGRVTFKCNIQAHHKKKWQSFNHSWAAICTFFNSDSWLLGLTGSQPKNHMNVIETSILFAI